MSDENNNVDAAAGSAPDGFMPGRPKDEPMMTSGHKPGITNFHRTDADDDKNEDNTPTFHIQTLPAGSAPPESTFEPQNDPEVPPAKAAKDAKPPTAQDTLKGSTSK